MRITPLDVRKQEFRKAVRGFDCDEVRAFLTTLADEYETVLLDNKQVRETLMEQEDKIGEYKTMERTLRDTLMTAEKLMQETRETANKEGDIIIQEAHQKAKGILEECRIRTEELRREIVGLRKEKETYLARFKGLAEAQISFIEAHKNDFADLDKRLVDMVDSVVEGTVDSEAESRNKLASATAAPVAPAAQTTVIPETSYTAPVEPASHSQEVDQWRDYDPKGDSGPESSNGQTPSASPEAQTSQPENAVNEVIADTAPSGVTREDVEMASRGIPVPAKKSETEENTAEDSDAITEAISATLTEAPTPQTSGNSSNW